MHQILMDLLPFNKVLECILCYYQRYQMTSFPVKRAKYNYKKPEVVHIANRTILLLIVSCRGYKNQRSFTWPTGTSYY